MSDRTAARRKPAARQDRGPAVGLEPRPGYYKTRLTRSGQELPVVIWFGPPLCPDTGASLDRAHRLQCRCGGEDFDPYALWPMRQIDRAEFDRLVAALGDDVRMKRDLAQEAPLF